MAKVNGLWLGLGIGLGLVLNVAVRVREENYLAKMYSCKKTRGPVTCNATFEWNNWPSLQGPNFSPVRDSYKGYITKLVEKLLFNPFVKLKGTYKVT